MCGIAGYVNLDGAPADADVLCRMIRTLRHRGPDGFGVKALGAAGLAHARLSIIDLATGAQPMTTSDRPLWITFNGEIYNYIELREELLALGHRFATQSDTEVILRAYLQFGEACVHRFNGQFAFAIWDEAARRLFAARDRLGKKPFYYAKGPRAFVFGSELKALIAHGEIPKRLNPRALDQVLTFWCTTPPETMLADVMELPPGATLVLSGSDVRVSRYWQLEYSSENGHRTEDDYAEELYALLVDAIRLRMLRSDVPVGAYLSGGLDSTVITTLITRHTDVPLRTFSVTFEDPEFDEGPHQRRVVDALGLTDHMETHCRAEEIGRVFPEVIRHTEQPVVRTAPAPLYLLSRLVRQHDYRVVLTGEGSDEMLGGYDIFKEAKIRRFWAQQPESRLRPLLLRRLYPYLPALQSQSPAYLRAFFHASPAALGDPFFSHQPRWEMTSRIKAFFSPETREALDGYSARDALHAQLPAPYGGWKPFAQSQYLESSVLLPGYILSSQGDRVQMAHSVEGRCPFLDYRIAEFAAALPPALKMKVLDEKHLLKKATAGVIPSFVGQRAKQPYRSMEVSSFFDTARKKARFDYVDEMLDPASLGQRGVFHAPAVGRLVDKARSGDVIGLKDSMALVAILSTEIAAAQLLGEPREWMA
jgi:asparagine synthase (glutamine-hydrolysing)